jgi:hypothetical protein
MEPKWQIVIALYAAVISTLVLIWRLIEFYLEKAGRIKVLALIDKRALLDTNNRIIEYFINIELPLLISVDTKE